MAATFDTNNFKMEALQTPDEQKCKNCGAVVDSKYCKECGQKAIEHKQTIWHLTMHFLSDILHYDGRFIRTLKLLLTKPGFLSSEYKNGARQKYVDPFKLYLFISAAAFIVFITLDKPENTSTRISNPAIIHFIDSTRAALQKDSTHLARMEKSKYRTIKTKAYGKKIEIFEVSNMFRHGVPYYDSVQNTLLPEKRSKGYRRYKERCVVKIFELYDTAPYNYLKKTHERINLVIPKSFLLSMPFFIFGLYVLNYKRRKDFPSAYHAIFTMHFYATIWVFITFDSIVSSFLENPATETIYEYIGYAIFSGCLVYLYVAMHRFYKERWWLTLIKAIVLIIFTGFMYYRILLILKEYYITSLVSLPA